MPPCAPARAWLRRDLRRFGASSSARGLATSSASPWPRPGRRARSSSPSALGSSPEPRTAAFFAGPLFFAATAPRPTPRAPFFAGFLAGAFAFAETFAFFGVEPPPLAAVLPTVRGVAAFVTLFFLPFLVAMRERQYALFGTSSHQSGRLDSNQRPLDPQSSALTRLRYAPRGPCVSHADRRAT